MSFLKNSIFWNFYRPLPCDLPFERRIRLTVGARAVPRRMVNECLRHMLKYICSSPISLLDFPRLTLAKAKEMLKRTAAPGVSRLVGAYWVR